MLRAESSIRHRLGSRAPRAGTRCRLPARSRSSDRRVASEVEAPTRIGRERQPATAPSDLTQKAVPCNISFGRANLPGAATDQGGLALVVAPSDDSTVRPHEGQPIGEEDIKPGTTILSGVRIVLAVVLPSRPQVEVFLEQNTVDSGWIVEKTIDKRLHAVIEQADGSFVAVCDVPGERQALRRAQGGGQGEGDGQEQATSWCA